MSEQTGKLRVEMKVGFKTKQHGRKVLTLPSKPKPSPQPQKMIPRQARLLALAHRWQRLLDEGHIESQAEIAEIMGISKARVSQILDLALLPPSVQERFTASGS